VTELASAGAQGGASLAEFVQKLRFVIVVSASSTF